MDNFMMNGLGIFFGFLSILMGLWSKPNVYEKNSLAKRILSFLIFLPIGVFFGFAMGLFLKIDLMFGFIPVVVGFLASDKLEEYLRRSLRMGDGPTAAFFLKLADNDGDEVSRQFQLNSIKIKIEKDLKGETTTVDDLITAYNSARHQFGLSSLEDLDKKAPYI